MLSVPRMFEHRSHPLISRRAFLRRVGRCGLWAAALLGTCLGVGIAGYHFIEGFSWVDAVLNASMILSGMGPADPLNTTPGKLFASFYALLSGVAFISTMGLLLAAPLHRLMHRFHLEVPPADDETRSHATREAKPAHESKRADSRQ